MAIYLDYNATTPVDPVVQQAICSALKDSWGNPSSSYEIGKRAKHVVEDARSKVANMVGALPEEIVFTSGGTESNNTVIQTSIRHFYAELHCPINNGIEREIPHVITTNIEHDSIKLPLQMFAKAGKIDVTFVPVSKVTGMVEVDDIMSQIRPNTSLITVMLANNETGVIQPVSLLRSRLNALKRKSSYKPLHRIYLHTDAAQAIGKIKVNVNELCVDYMTIVGHKFYGPRIGALYFRLSTPLCPIFYGGGQERNYRPGTENTCMIAGLGKAAELVTLNLSKYEAHMLSVRDYLEKSLKDIFCDKVIFNVKTGVFRLPNTVSVAFDYEGLTGHKILFLASGICASTGAACHSGGKPSAVLCASGLSDTLASQTLRLSVGRETTNNDIDIAVQNLKVTVEKLQA